MPKCNSVLQTEVELSTRNSTKFVRKSTFWPFFGPQNLKKISPVNKKVFNLKFQFRREYEKDKLALNRAEHSLKKIEESLKRNHSQSKHTLELKSHQNKQSMKLVSVRQVIEQTIWKLKGVMDKTVRSRETRTEIREGNNVLVS